MSMSPAGSRSFPQSVFPAFARRLPFTLLILAGILLVTAVTNSLARPIAPAVLARWGFGFEDLKTGHLLPLLLTPFQILKPYMAITVSVGLVLFLGACEYRLGTRRAIVVFWVTHGLAYVGSFLILGLLGKLGVHAADHMLLHKDVGASNGMFGAAGAALASLPERLRRNLFLAILAYLVLAIVVEQQLWDLEHLIAFLTGVGLGGAFLLRSGYGWPGPLPPFQLERRQRPVVLSWAIAVMGLANLLEPFVLSHRPGLVLLESALPLVVHHAPRHLLLACGIGLLFLVPGLARGQRSAWSVTLAILVLSLLLHLRRGMHVLEIIPALAFLGLIIAWRKQFRAPSDPAAVGRGRRIALALVAGLPLYSLVGLFVLRSQFTEPFTLAQALRECGARIFFSSYGAFTPETHRGAWFLSSIPLVAWGGILYSLVLFRRLRPGPRPLLDQLSLARGILKQHGWNTTSTMTIWSGNSLFFGSGTDTYLAYQLHSGTAVILGDPIGPPAGIARLIAEFTTHAAGQGWDCCLYAVGPDHLDLYRATGFEALQIGEEAVLPLGRLAFTGKKWQTMRSAINRAGREGVRFQMFEGGTVPAPLKEQIAAISREWETGKSLPPMGFTLGKVTDIDDPEVNVAVAVDATGQVHAFADWLSVPTRRGWVIDLMRRRADSMNGVMEFLIGSSLLAFRDHGYDMASLATAPLADLDRDANSSLVQKMLGTVYERFDLYYPFRSLFEYKSKFQPQWEPVYLMHRGVSRLPGVGRAILEAYLPDLDLRQVMGLLGSAVSGLMERREEPPEERREDRPKDPDG